MPGVPWHTQILADQVTIFQPGGTDYAHLITPGFSDLPTALLVKNKSRIPLIILEVFWSEKHLVSSHYSQDPIIQTIWNEKIVAPYNAVPQIRPVYDGEKVFIGGHP